MVNRTNYGRWNKRKPRESKITATQPAALYQHFPKQLLRVAETPRDLLMLPKIGIDWTIPSACAPDTFSLSCRR
jgi:hypothetical protein